MKNLYLNTILFFIFLFPILTFAQYDGIQITTNDKNQNSPAIWDSVIVWMDLRHQSGFIPDARIYMYDLATETESQVYNLPYHQSLPDISDNRVVWQERDNIYMYDLNTDEYVPICEESGTQSFPKIEGNYVVWQDDRNGSNDDIYLYDIALDSIFQITNSTEIEQTQPDVSGENIIWLQNDSLYVHNISEASSYPIQSEVEIMDPAISGNWIVYRGYIDDAWQLFKYNLDTDEETQITFGDGSPLSPAISDKAIVWEDYRNDPSGYSNADIYLYDLATGTELPICTQENRQASPAIWDNRIVWEDNRNGNNDIYMAEYEEPTGVELEVTMSDDPDPVAQGYYVNFTINVTNNGPEAASDVRLGILLPGYLEYLSIAASQGDVSQFAATDTVYLGAMANGESAIITLMVTASGIGSVNTTVSVTSEKTDPNPANNSATAQTLISELTGKYFGRGWDPHIALDEQDVPHLSYTYHWFEGLIHYPEQSVVEGIGGYDIKYGYNAYGAWNKEMIYDGRWRTSNFTVPSTHSYKRGITSDITIDKDNIIHSVYAYENSDYITGQPVDNLSYSVRYRMKDDEGWSSSEELLVLESIVDRVHFSNGHGDPPGVYSPNIAIDSNGFIHITFMNCTGPAKQATIYYLTNASGEWVTTMLGNAYDCLDMAIDSDDHLHLSYYDISTTGLQYLTNSPDGLWQSPEAVDSVWAGGQMEGMQTGIDVDPSNQPHIVYVGQTDGDGVEDIKYAHKDPTGWHLEKVHDGLFQSASNAIAVDGTSTPHLCYFSLADNRLVYAVKSGIEWTKTNLDDKGKNRCDIAVTSEGTAHMAYTNDIPGENGRIYYVTNQEFIDSDLDGVSDAAEQGPDGSNPAYDGDGNGIPDYQQENAASFQTSDGENYVTLVCDTSLIFSNVSASNNPSSLDAPKGFGFPYGSFSFSVLGLNPGDSTTVDLILPAGTTIENFYKYGATQDSIYAHWYEFMYNGHTGAEIAGNVITLHLIDGQRGDDDLLVNGIIREPGVPAITVTGIVDNESLLPDEFSLSQNYPNPFNGQTQIKFSLSKTTKVELTIYNVLGQKIYDLVNEVMVPGRYNMIWNGKNDFGRHVASGIYFYRLKADGFVKTKKMLLVQ